MMTTTAPATDTEWRHLFGVCACLGEDFGFNPLFLRIALGIGMVWAPVAVLVGYFAVGAIVLASRLIAPNRRVVRSQEPATPQLVSANSDVIEPQLARAA